MARHLEYPWMGLLALTALVSVWQGDWMWLVMSLLGLIVLAIPRINHEGLSYRYHARLLVMALIPPMGYLALFILAEPLSIPYPELVGYALHCGGAMVYGYMLMMAIDQRSGTVLSKRWMLLLSIAFACAVSILYTFFTYYYMLTNGYLVVNEDFVGISPSPSNRVLMAPMTVAMAASIVYAFLIRSYLKHVDKNDLLIVGGGA